MTNSNPFYSATDLARLFGRSSQYWSKLMRSGKLKARQTSAGWITTHAWLEKSGYDKKTNA